MLRRIEQLLLLSKNNADGIVVKETHCPIGTGKWNAPSAAGEERMKMPA